MNRIHHKTLAEIDLMLDYGPITLVFSNGQEGTLKKHRNPRETGYMFITKYETYARTSLDSLVLQLAFGYSTTIKPHVGEALLPEKQQQKNEQPTMQIEMSDEQKERLRANIKLMDEAEKRGIDFDLFEYLKLISPENSEQES
jgi:hypothetical protein